MQPLRSPACSPCAALLCPAAADLAAAVQRLAHIQQQAAQEGAAGPVEDLDAAPH
jgi:predicted ATPase